MQYISLRHSISSANGSWAISRIKLRISHQPGTKYCESDLRRNSEIHLVWLVIHARREGSLKA